MRPGPTWVRSRRDSGAGTVAAILFACAFAAQSSQLALTPILASAARDFHVSTSVAGQLRTVAAVVALAAALAVDPLATRLSLRTLLRLGVTLLAAGAVLSLAAHDIVMFAVGQALGGAASSVLVVAGVSAAAVWSTNEDRGRVVAWALAGAPAAWVAAMPVIGAVAETAWQLAFAVPIGAAMLAAFLLRRAPGMSAQTSDESVRSLLASPAVRVWALGELLAYSAWSGVLLYAGALFIESYGASVSWVGWCLGLGAAAYIPGTFLARRLSGSSARSALAASSLLLAVFVVPFGGMHLGATSSAMSFAALCFLAGARVFLGSAAGLDLGGQRPAAAMSLRGAAQQLGGIVGAGGGGAALAAGGYRTLTVMLLALFGGAAVLQLRLSRVTTTRDCERATRRARRPLVAARARAR